MRVYIITYDIKGTWIRNYNPLFNALRAFPHWMHHMDNTWFVVSDLTAEDIYNNLRPHIFVDSRLLIVAITRDYYGYLNQDAWSWLDTYRHLM